MKTQSHRSVSAVLSLIMASSFILTACGGSSDPNEAVDVAPYTATHSGAADPSGTTHQTGNGSTNGSITPTPTPASSSTASNLDAAGYPSCVTSDANHLCIGLKVVSYESSGKTILSEAAALTLIEGMNTVWNQCNIGFQLEKYVSLDPTTKGLSYNPNWQSESTTIRNAFAESNMFVVIAVGTLSGSTIAVTEMPGGSPYGTLVEASYANNPLTVGHEIGHYQGLYHISDSSNLMNPYIGTNTSGLNASQCSTARSTDASDWTAMLRY